MPGRKRREIRNIVGSVTSDSILEISERENHLSLVGRKLQADKNLT